MKRDKAKRRSALSTHHRRRLQQPVSGIREGEDTKRERSRCQGGARVSARHLLSGDSSIANTVYRELINHSERNAITRTCDTWTNLFEFSLRLALPYYKSLVRRVAYSRLARTLQASYVKGDARPRCHRRIRGMAEINLANSYDEQPRETIHKRVH
jgi:hypothetical protein